MPKECDCTEESLGLPTLYPYNYNYCPRCGKELQYITREEYLEKLKDIGEQIR